MSFFLFFYEQHGLCNLHMSSVRLQNYRRHICNCLTLSKNCCVPWIFLSSSKLWVAVIIFENISNCNIVLFKLGFVKIVGIIKPIKRDWHDKLSPIKEIIYWDFKCENILVAKELTVALNLSQKKKITWQQYFI